MSIIYLLTLVLACVLSYLCGKWAEQGYDLASLLALLGAFLSFFLGLGGLLHA